MSDYQDRMRDQFRAAARRELGAASTRPAPPNNSRPTARALALVTAALAVSGTALTATRPWEPILGDPSHPTTQSSSSPPGAQLQMLGVLRRAPTAADRDLATQATFTYIGPGSKNVRAQFIRRLASSAPGRAVVLVPAERFALPDGVAVNDALCVFYSERDSDGGGKACFDTAQIRAGTATASLGHDVYGLVPDGVSSVSAFFETGPAVTGAVHDNFFVVRSPGGNGDQLPKAISWQDVNGKSAGPPYR